MSSNEAISSTKKDKNLIQHIVNDEDKKSNKNGTSPSILKRVNIKRRTSGSSTTAPEGSSLNHYPEHESLGSIENQYPRSLRSQFGYVVFIIGLE